MGREPGVSVSPGALARFLQGFEQVYENLGKTESIISAAAAHHRLLWMHPFLDGNGRVARLMSHAVFLDILDTGAVWSVARGLARNVQEYKNLLANCDLPRRNDLDGPGALREEALAEFTRFFLSTCVDQSRLHGEPHATGPPARADFVMGGGGNKNRRSAAEVRRYYRGRSLSWGAAPRRCRFGGGHRRTASAPCRFCTRE